MFYYIFLDPVIIDEAEKAGSMGLGRLIDFLRDLKTDCLLAETDLYRVAPQIKERIQAIKSQHDRKIIGDILISWLQDMRPALYLNGDCEDFSLKEFAQNCDVDYDLDLILTDSDHKKSHENSWEMSNLEQIHLTTFAQTRSNTLRKGKRYGAGEKNHHHIYSECFSKMVRYAEDLIIIDYALGKFWGNDQPINLKRFIRFFRDEAKLLTKLTILTSGNQSRHLQNEINNLNNEVNFDIELTIKNEDELPHTRYLIADKLCLDIDRGVDICDHDGNSRNIIIKHTAKPKL